MGQSDNKEAVKMAGAVLSRDKEDYLKRQKQVLKHMDTNTYTKNKDNAMNNLIQAGIITKNGNLKKVYKG